MNIRKNNHQKVGGGIVGTIATAAPADQVVAY
jgi:hypothetical protein